MGTSEPVDIKSVIVLCCIIAVVAAIIISPLFIYISTLRKVLLKCSAENRSISPRSIWLLLIPLFNLFWHFFVVWRVASSLGKEFESRGIKGFFRPGRIIGLTMCGFALLSVITIGVVRIAFAGVAALCWLGYWGEMCNISFRLDGSKPIY